MFTPLPITLQDTELPQRLNCPFYYQPHPLCMTAAEEAKKEIMSMTEWEEEIHQGKMFGILIVRDSDLNVGYLKAYSGQIGGRQDWRGWVPAIFDYLQPDGYFKQHEAEITHINHEISRLLSSDVHRINCARLAKAEKEMLVQYNAASKADPPKVNFKEPEILEPEEVADLLDALETEPLKWRLFVELLLVTSGRRGEVGAIKWKKIDFDTHILLIA